MTALRNALLALLCVLPAVAHAEATLRLATPGDPITNPVNDTEITANEIDAALGNSFFSATANDLFADLADMRAALAVDIRDAFLSNAKIKSVESVVVETDPISARLKQQSTAIALSVSGIEAAVQATSNEPSIPLFCSSVKFTAELSFTGSGSFSFASLVLNDLTVNQPSVNVTSASCSGVLGFLGDIFAEIFGEGVEDEVQQRIESGLQNFAGFSSLPTMFSFADLAQDLVQAVPPGPVAAKVLPVVEQFLFLASQNAGLRLDIELRPDFYGPGGHLISFTAPHQTPQLFVEQIPNQTLISVSTPMAQRHEIYAKPFGGWIHLGTTFTDSLIAPQQPQGTEIRAIAVNGLVLGLTSFAARKFAPTPVGGGGCTTEPCQQPL